MTEEDYSGRSAGELFGMILDSHPDYKTHVKAAQALRSSKSSISRMINNDTLIREKWLCERAANVGSRREILQSCPRWEELKVYFLGKIVTTNRGRQPGKLKMTTAGGLLEAIARTKYKRQIDFAMAFGVAPRFWRQKVQKWEDVSATWLNKPVKKGYKTRLTVLTEYLGDEGYLYCTHLAEKLRPLNSRAGNAHKRVHDETKSGLTEGWRTAMAEVLGALDSMSEANLLAEGAYFGVKGGQQRGLQIYRNAATRLCEELNLPEKYEAIAAVAKAARVRIGAMPEDRDEKILWAYRRLRVLMPEVRKLTVS